MRILLNAGGWGGVVLAALSIAAFLLWPEWGLPQRIVFTVAVAAVLLLMFGLPLIVNRRLSRGGKDGASAPVRWRLWLALGNLVLVMTPWLALIPFMNPTEPDTTACLHATSPCDVQLRPNTRFSLIALILGVAVALFVLRIALRRRRQGT